MSKKYIISEDGMKGLANTILTAKRFNPTFSDSKIVEEYCNSNLLEKYHVLEEYKEPEKDNPLLVKFNAGDIVYWANTSDLSIRKLVAPCMLFHNCSTQFKEKIIFDDGTYYKTHLIFKTPEEAFKYLEDN